MKTKIEIEIETPERFTLKDYDDDTVTFSEEEELEYAKDWHRAIVSFYKNIEHKLAYDDFIEFEEFYSEDGELPTYKLSVKEVIPSVNRNKGRFECTNCKKRFETEDEIKAHFFDSQHSWGGILDTEYEEPGSSGKGK